MHSGRAVLGLFAALLVVVITYTVRIIAKLHQQVYSSTDPCWLDILLDPETIFTIIVVTRISAIEAFRIQFLSHEQWVLTQSRLGCCGYGM